MYTRLLTSIDLCNTAPDRFYITSDLTYGETGKSNLPRALDTKVVNCFLEKISEELNKPRNFIPLSQWYTIDRVITTFIQNSKEIDEDDKKILTLSIKTSSQFHKNTYPVIQVKDLVMQDRPLTTAKLRNLEHALIQIEGERRALQHRVLYSATELFKFLAVLDFIEHGGHIRKCDKGFSIDWERCPKLIAEEFALSARMEKRIAESESNFRPTLEKLFSEYEGQDIPPILHLWRHFLTICELQRLSYLFGQLICADKQVFTLPNDSAKMFFSDEMHLILIESENYEQIPGVNDSGKKTWEERKRAAKQYLEAVCKLFSRYHQQVDKINIFYKKIIEKIESEKKPGFQHKTDPLSPTEFDNLTLKPIDFESLEKKFQYSHPEYIKNVLNEDEAYTFEWFFDLIGQPTSHQYVTHLEKQFFKLHDFYKPLPKHPEQSAVKSNTITVEQITNDISSLSITATAPTKEAKKKSRSRPHYHPKPDPVRKLTLIPTNFTLHARVQDWFQQNPIALSQEPYVHLSDARKADAHFFHSYPLVITQILLQEIKAEPWPSPTTRKINNLYMRPGTIWQYGKDRQPEEGYFADTFGPELYHHFFHRISFSTLMQRYQNKTALVSAQDIEESEASNAPPIAATQTRSFTIEKKRYTIEVDDKENKIKYTICFPEGLN